ncbi:NADP-dependent oxidoreductase [Cellulomonas taurus]|jgi:NADPH:quinone reductase-like Zn-dependent oxidoreductase|uniref:NADP-dependent oxidoreductase n=1 Tax=Cellulomonas taurus TaxID=2729175 RepID=UPI00145EDA16|nr:NADP-dependent oxidoreductase [Cellulomonas taurus]
MRAARYHQYGDPSVLRVEDAPEPHAGPGTVRIRTLTVSVNPIDWKLRQGLAAQMIPLEFPVIPGRDAAGVVDEVGDGVDGVAVGDLVFGMGGVSDTTAEFSVLSAWAPVPEGWSVEQAASAGLASTTAIPALAALGDLSGKTLVVNGASGAVGSAAAIFAIDAGARVIGTASERNHAFLSELGVTPVRYGAGLAERIGSADAALDAAGHGALPELIAITGSPDRVVTVADNHAAGELGVRAISASNDSESLRTAARLGAAGAYLPRVDTVLPLEQIAEAHRVAESGETAGKIVIRITD